MKTILKFYMRLMMLVLPISFLPLVVDSFSLGRNWLLMVGAMLGVLVWGIGLAVSKDRQVKVSSIWWIMGALVVFAWVQWWFRLGIGVRMRSVVDFGGIGSLTAWWAWLFLWLQTDDDREAQINWLTVAGGMVGLLSIALFLYPAAKLPIVWPKDNPLLNISATWSITGSLLNEVVLMLFLVVEWVKRLVTKLSAK